jgi:hypothetical protein
MAKDSSSLPPYSHVWQPDQAWECPLATGAKRFGKKDTASMPNDKHLKRHVFLGSHRSARQFGSLHWARDFNVLGEFDTVRFELNEI